MTVKLSFFTSGYLFLLLILIANPAAVSPLIDWATPAGTCAAMSIAGIAMIWLRMK